MVPKGKPGSKRRTHVLMVFHMGIAPACGIRVRYVVNGSRLRRRERVGGKRKRLDEKRKEVRVKQTIQTASIFAV